MTRIRAAFYARVSSEQQAAAHTIESQVSALTERARSDGTPVPLERQFVDDGISGATLARTALDRTPRGLFVAKNFGLIGRRAIYQAKLFEEGSGSFPHGCILVQECLNNNIANVFTPD